MERLTQKSINYCAEICRAQDCETYHGVRNDVCGDAAIYNRLAAYEDTGMEPKEVKAKCAWADNVCKMLSGIFEDSGVFDFSHIKELITAEHEGRLVVLPCKVGDHLFAVTRNIVSEFAVSHFEMHSDLMWAGWDIVDGIFGHFRIDGIPADIIGKTVFLTRAEAEKAMEVTDDA